MKRKAILILSFFLLPLCAYAELIPISDSEMDRITGKIGLAMFLDFMTEASIEHMYHVDQGSRFKTSGTIYIAGLPHTYYQDVNNEMSRLSNALTRIGRFMNTHVNKNIKGLEGPGTLFIGGLPHHYTSIYHITAASGINASLYQYNNRLDNTGQMRIYPTG
jgi:hypothetical protein